VLDGGAAEVTRLPDGIRITCNGDIDYWEVDPEWDGALFRSAAQTQRTNDGSEVPAEIRIKGGRRVCVRVVTTKGELIQQVSDV
jgi:hypothetical protein